MAAAKNIPTWTNRPNISDDTIQRVYGLGAKVIKRGKKWTVKPGRIPTLQERTPNNYLGDYNAGNVVSFTHKYPHVNDDEYFVTRDRNEQGYLTIRRSETTDLTPEQKWGLREYDTETTRLKGLYANDLAAYDAGTDKTAGAITDTYNAGADQAARDAQAINKSMEGLARLTASGYNQQDPTAQVAAQTATQGAAANAASNLYGINESAAVMRDAGSSAAASFRNQSAAGRGQIMADQRQMDASRITGRRETLSGMRSANAEAAAAAEQQAYERDFKNKELQAEMRGDSLQAISNLLGIQGEYGVAALREQGANDRNTQDNTTRLQTAKLDAVSKAEARAQQLQVEIAKLQQRATEEDGRNRRKILEVLNKKKAAQKKANADVRKTKQARSRDISKARLLLRNISAKGAGEELDDGTFRRYSEDELVEAIVTEFDTIGVDLARKIAKQEALRAGRAGIGLSGTGSI